MHFLRSSSVCVVLPKDFVFFGLAHIKLYINGIAYTNISYELDNYITVQEKWYWNGNIFF